MKKESRAPQLLMKLKRKGFWSRKNIFWKEKRFLFVIGEKKERCKKKRFLEKVKGFLVLEKKNKRFKEEN